MPHLGKEADARALIRELLVSSADRIPDLTANTLTVRVHHMTCAAHDAAVVALFSDLNAWAFKHPQTEMQLVDEWV